MKKGDILKNIEIEKLVFGGKGFKRLEDGKVLFVRGGAIPGAVFDIKIVKKKKDFLEGQIVAKIKKSPIETGDKELLPGAPWLNIDYNEQLKIKQNQLIESLFHLKKYQEDIDVLDIVPSPIIDGYRNKIEFSFGKYISHKEEIFKDFQLGFHKQGEFSKILDFESCMLIDEELNNIYAEVREFTKSSGLLVYDQKTGEGFWRHLMMRKAYFTGEIMMVFSVFPNYSDDKNFKSEYSEMITDFISNLNKKYTNITSVYISHNDNKSDTVIGNLENIFGDPVITEKLLDLSFEIGPKSFFQTNSPGAQVLYSVAKSFLREDNNKVSTLLDLYAGTGTLGMIFSENADKVYSVELVEEASKSGEKNAKKNGITNIVYKNLKVEDFVENFKKDNNANVVIIDPPRAGMHPTAPDNILALEPNQIIYISCNPATLARDLEYFIKDNTYKIEKIQAVDMFPHTHHLEVVTSLIKI